MIDSRLFPDVTMVLVPEGQLDEMQWRLCQWAEGDDSLRSPMTRVRMVMPAREIGIVLILFTYHFDSS